MKKLSIFLTVAVCLLAFPFLVQADTPDLDFEGETVTYVDYWDPFGDVERRKEEAEALFNVNLEYMTVDDHVDTIVSRVLAGDATHDIVRVSKLQFWPLMAENALYPVGDYLGNDFYEEQPGFLRTVNRDKFQFENQSYGFSVADSGIWNMKFLQYNVDLFERYGLEDPFELWQAGEWTWDVFREQMVALTDETQDQYGITNLELDGLSLSNNAKIVDDEDGKMVFAYDREEGIETLEFYLDMEDLGVIGGTDEDFRAGNVGMQPGETWVFHKDNHEGMEDERNFVPWPAGPSADKPQIGMGNVATHMLPITAEEPEALVELHNWLFAEQIQDDELIMEWLVADYIESEEDLKFFEWVMEEWSGEGYMVESLIGAFFAAGTDAEEPFARAIGYVIEGERSPEAALSAEKEAIQAILDDTFN